MTKTALIVSPYLDHLGGGERYILTLCSVLETLGYDLDFAWDNAQEIAHLAKMLGINLSSPKVNPSLKDLYHSHNPVRSYLATCRYDLTVYLSDGSIPLLGSRTNILHFQVPFHQIGGRSLKNRLKKLTISQIIVNSRFTKQVVDQEYGINSTVLYPPVPFIQSQDKQKIILSVGRFEPSLNAKKQDILITAFAELAPKLPGWELVLAGATTSQDWVNQLREKARGLPVRFVVNAEYSDLKDLYSHASIYWHAAGYGVDPSQNPELTEHFGISTVEAISAKAIPLVVGSGGQVEIVRDPKLLWQSTGELVQKTIAVSNHTFADYQNNLDIAAYSLDSFSHQLTELLK